VLARSRLTCAQFDAGGVGCKGGEAMAVVYSITTAVCLGTQVVDREIAASFQHLFLEQLDVSDEIASLIIRSSEQTIINS